jgi:toxin ParE1/3/4
VVRRIVAVTRSLTDFPLAGRKVPEFDDGSIRELLVYSYRIIYIAEEGQVTVVSVIHGKQML